jgi:hypothetical protein
LASIFLILAAILFFSLYHDHLLGLNPTRPAVTQTTMPAKTTYFYSQIAAVRSLNYIQILLRRDLHAPVGQATHRQAQVEMAIKLARRQIAATSATSALARTEKRRVLRLLTDFSCIAHRRSSVCLDKATRDAAGLLGFHLQHLF